MQELAHEEVVRSVKLEQAKEVTKLRQEVEQGAKELASKYERKMKVCLCPHFLTQPPVAFACFTLTVFHTGSAYIYQVQQATTEILVKMSTCSYGHLACHKDTLQHHRCLL